VIDNPIPMKTLTLLVLSVILSFSCCLAQPLVTKHGIFDNVQDIGKPKHQGSSVYNGPSQEYTLSGSGKNIWAKADEFHFASLEMDGDMIVTAFCRFEDKGTELHRKMGIMIREKLDSGARYADAVIHGDGLTSFQYRDSENTDTKEIKAELKAPEVIQLERKGDTLIMRAAKFGDPFTETGKINMSFKNPVYVGLFVCSHNPDVTEKAVFSNVRIDVPAKENGNDNGKPAASRVEIMDVKTGLRKVIYTTADHLEAPNWSKDGKFLIYNSGGNLYRLPIKGKSPKKINTGEANNCNNDHGLSFDGKMLAISSGTKLAYGRTGSMVYTVPIEGGIAKPVTKNVPSYWHGWSPDGKTLVFCGERNGNFDVWSIPSKGGEEHRLTDAVGLDDGPEYSPDGKFIYFNSVRSGLMKIWRMLPDGSHQEQISFGNYNDWFAHISPDGKSMVYISYSDDVPAGSHPGNKRVMMRLQNTDSPKPKVLAYIYGGQGTMNVPSWSPDGKSVAFVSFTYGRPEF
jgi:TolB protein